MRYASFFFLKVLHVSGQINLLKLLILLLFLSVLYVKSHVPCDLRMNKSDTLMNIKLRILPVFLDSETLYPTYVGIKTIKNK